MIITWTDNDRSIKIRWRDKDKIRKEKVISDFKPYFFIRSIDNKPDTYKTKHHIIGKIQSNKQVSMNIKKVIGET